MSARLRVERIDDAGPEGREALARLGVELARLERGVTYPLGADRFEIDHGDDYFAFFRRLGALRVFVGRDGDALEGVLVAVRRRRPAAVDYLCDLKAAPGRSRGRVLRPLIDAYVAATPADVPGYGISMNPPDERNRLARLAPRLVPGAAARARLVLFSLGAEDARRAAPAVGERFGATPSWLSLAGVKDIVLESTGRPMPLRHAQVGPTAASSASTGAAVSDAPVDGSVHMFCVPDDDRLVATLGALGLTPDASATVLARGLAGPFDFVLTSDI